MAYTISGDDTMLDVDAAIGTFAERLGRDDIAGAFDDYRFYAANGRQVLLGHHDAAPVHPGEIIDMGSHSRAGGESGAAVNAAFVTKESNQPRHASN